MILKLKQVILVCTVKTDCLWHEGNKGKCEPVLRELSLYFCFYIFCEVILSNAK